MNADLAEKRKKLDAIDAEISDALERRAELVAGIASLKREIGEPPKDLAREAIVAIGFADRATRVRKEDALLAARVIIRVTRAGK